MSILKPGQQRPSINLTNRKSFVENSVPAQVPVTENFESPNPGLAIQTIAKLPNQRGKGGRPTKAQSRDAGYMEGAQKAIEEIREANPPLLAAAPHRSGKMEIQRSWEKAYDAREKSLERQEAEAILAARSERLAALEEETAIRRANRKVGVAAGLAAFTMVRTLGDVAERLDKKVRESKDMSFSELRGAINTLSGSVSKMQSAMETVARLERTITRRPLDEEGVNSVSEDDLSNLSVEDAEKILENILKTTYHTAKSAGIKIYDGTAEVVETSEEVSNGEVES